MAIRHVERAESTFKVAHKNAKSRKYTFWPNRTQKILENSRFGFRRNFFLVFLNYVNNYKPDEDKKQTS